jgi:hypothetical protein
MFAPAPIFSVDPGSIRTRPELTESKGFFFAVSLQPYERMPFRTPHSCLGQLRSDFFIDVELVEIWYREVAEYEVG